VHGLSSDAANLGEECIPEESVEKAYEQTEELAKHSTQRCLDAITSEELLADLTAASRTEELAFMQEWGVWETVPTAECWKRTRKVPLQGNWVDVNNGDGIAQ
jgi:hypothetical protein